MKLKTIILENFRVYKNKTTIKIDDITAFIGKNDVGKSSILEALEIFFNNDIVKIESQDINVFSNSRKVIIGCGFSDLPNEVIIDATVRTTLSDEFMLNDEGFLEIHKVFDFSTQKPKESVFISAMHPTADKINDLLTLKNSDLKNRAQELGILENKYDKRINSSIRKAIWGNYNENELRLSIVPIPLMEEDAKKMWENLRLYIPTFALFHADRPSKDGDAEVQDPMKIAISRAIKEVEPELEKIKRTVQQKSTEVAEQTLEKLKEMDPSLGDSLSPKFKSEPNWKSLFKITLEGKDEIPINKRGSGTRRLILLNFFRAEAERKQDETNSPGIIYAMEEPETSQHPNNQRMLIEALTELSKKDNYQVLLTTHVPTLAELLPLESLRFVESVITNDNVKISSGSDDIYEKIVKSLGVLPDKRVKVLFCVEGPNDVNFFRNISEILHVIDDDIPDLYSEYKIAFVVLGGGNLRHWVNNYYLKNLGIPEVHIYDRDNKKPPKYETAADKINKRNDDSWAVITSKNEIENYIHPEAIKEVFKISQDITFTDDDNVPSLVAGLTNIKESTVKEKLNNKAVRKMDYNKLCQIDTNREIESWLRKIGKMLK